MAAGISNTQIKEAIIKHCELVASLSKDSRKYIHERGVIKGTFQLISSHLNATLIYNCKDHFIVNDNGHRSLYKLTSDEAKETLQNELPAVRLFN